uniref:cilia and flagella-associated protein 47-like n=1 Tax=Semicossyphus pulcher TaxID=241346 RepID=UPI0037E78C74
MAGSCVRVDPPVVEFSDVKVGQVYKMTVRATNVGKTSTKICIERPALKLFKFTASSYAEVVASGLSVSGLLEFTPEEEEEVRDCLLIHVNDVQTIKVPLLGFPRACSLLMDSVVDFGCVAASSQVISKRHLITNQGSAPGLYHVQYNGDPSVRLSPCSGVVAAGATQWLKVELRTDRPRQIEERALVKLQNRSPVTLRIKAEVVDQHLEVFDLQGAPLSSLWFGPVYFGTSHVENVVLRNNAPQACDWVCLLQSTAAGTEGGTDLQKSTDAALLERMSRCSPSTGDVSQVLDFVPKQGRLGPYDKTTVAIRFSPVCKSTNESRKRESSASRQDYCLFLLFESVGSRHGFTHCHANSSVELAVTGSGLPVSLVPSPSHRFGFPTCVTGRRIDQMCVLRNLCPQLPVTFRFRKLAHFAAKPSSGTISPGQCQDVVLSFTARQQGSFRVLQKLDVLGHVVQRGGNKDGDTGLEFCSFHTITLELSAVCCSETTHPGPQLNPGITPAVTNPTGSQPHVRCSDLALCRGMAHAAVLSADKTRLHKHRRERRKSTEGEEFLAFPNDQAASIRPASAGRQYRTIFTGVQRYRYVDTDYSFTEEEEEQRQRHRQVYKDFIQELRETRLEKIKERQQEKVEDDVDIGIVPSQGLVPPTLRISNLESCKISETKPNYGNAPATTQQVISQVSEAMHAVPSISQEVADCNRTLTAQELYQVEIGPLVVDFGEVCAQSVCVEKLELINHLSVFIWVQLAVDCPELQGSSPLSHVLPPHSRNTLPLTFQSSKQGPFYRPVSYSVNQQHSGQILVQAKVVPVALELSTTQLVLRPTPNLLAQSGYRSSVTLRNPRNHAAEFTWKPVVTESGILFSIRPAKGTVEPYRELDCEVVWHPSFSSPAEGDFDLCVREGNAQRLHCVAKVGPTSVQLAEKQITFGSVPLNMPSFRTAVLHNTGQNHAYYQVLDVCPLPGLAVSPSEGVVPKGGQATLKIHFNPDSVVKFDTRVEIALRSMKSTELRVGGSVEHPNVDISVSHFQFYGVHAGSRRAIPFSLTNHSSAAARVTFDLSEYTDFSLQLPQLSPSAKKEPGVSVLEVQGHQTLDCSLVFSPTQAASYDFDLPLKVNGVRWPAASLSPLPTPPSSSPSTSSTLTAGSRNHAVRSLPRSVTMATRRSQRIQATVLCAPLEMSPSSLQFQVEPSAPHSDFATKTVELKAASQASVFWHGGVREHVNWWFDCSVAALTPDRREGELQVCAVSPSSGCVGPSQSVCLVVSIRPEAIRPGSRNVTRLRLPLYLGYEGSEVIGAEAGHQPYRELSITINHQHPRITVLPPQITLTPVPLESNAGATLTLLAEGYPSGTSVSAEADEVELEDGTKMQPLSVTFPEGNTIPARNQDQRETVRAQNQEANATALICSVSFCSAIPLSLCTTITFTDHLHNRFKVKLCAIADNCQLTVWPYMALHRSNQQIVLKTGTTAVEAILQRCHTPSPALGPTSSSSSSFDHNSSASKTSASDSFPGSDSVSDQPSRDTDVSPNRDTPTNLGVPEFPAANTEEGLYYQNVLMAAERWFSLFGWPSGPHPITVPHTLRRNVSKIQTNHSSGRTYRVSINKDSRSVVDMLHHLTGKQIPGISRCQTFSNDVDKRTNQLLQQHEAMLAFLRVQGASLCHIRPQYLLDMQEFKHWCSLQDEDGVDYSSADYDSLSKRSWTDVLLQIYKVLVLRRVSRSTTPKRGEVDGIVPVSSQPLASNIYSSWELQLLSWLNTHYLCMRETVWGTGNVPSARWIVNFDLDLTDGLVLAALLAAYCPYLIGSHFRRMYTTTGSLEQILHNNIIVVQALTALCLNLDVQPTDLSDPNPVQMLMLCVHLYERLPQYLPLHTITLSGGLHGTFSKQVRLKSPSSKPVKYHVFLLGEDARLFSLPGGSTVTIPPKGSADLTVQYSCFFMQPMEAVLLLISSPPVGLCSTTLAFSLKTHVTDITPTKTVKCKSPCYQLKVIQVPVANPFNKDATFRVVLVESPFNPLEPEKKRDSLVQQASSKANEEKMTTDKSCGEEVEGKPSDLNGEGSEFLSAARSVCLKSGQADTLILHYLPFCPGTKHCSVLLICPQVGDMVYMVKATAELPLPSPLTARPSANIVSIPLNSATAVCVSALSLRCRVGQVCEETLRVPLVNMAWEQALSIWGQHSMSADERRRRMLTHTLHSSTVRATAAAHKLVKQATQMRGSKELEYSVEVSLPQYFTLPGAVTIPINNSNIPWENPADCGCVDIPLRFQADSVGQFTCHVVLSSWCDTRVYVLEAEVTSQEGSVHLDFSTPAHHSVTQDIPLHNETLKDWKVRAELSGEGFSGPKVVNVPAGTKVNYPLTFHPSAQSTVMGKLSLFKDCDCMEHVFTLRGVGDHPLPVDHVVLHCRAGETVHAQLDVPNYSQKKQTLTVVTDLSVISGTPSLEIKPGHNAPYTLAVFPWKRGKQTGCVSFVENDGMQEGDCHPGNTLGRYKVHFSLEIICEPAAPIKVIDVNCAAQSSVAIEIPVSNPLGELLILDVYLEGDDLSGANRASVPPRETLTYKATFSPGRVGKRRGSLSFQSELVGEFWYQLELYALPPPVITLPQACCQLGKWTRQTVPVVNPTAETLKIIVANSNPRNYTLETDSVRPLIVEPHSSTQLGIRFSPSSIGEGNHAAKITFKCPQLQDWCVLLRGRGLKPTSQEPLSISAPIGSNTSVSVPFTNPTELPAVLSITLTDEDPSGDPNCHPAPPDRTVFFIPLSHTEGVHISEGATFDVPVVFAPNSMELQRAWLCIAMKPLGNNISSFSAHRARSEKELSTICWIYPLRGIPMEAPVENSELGVLRCAAGCQLERKVDVPLAGCAPGNQDQEGQKVSQVSIEDFLCEVHPSSKAEHSEARSCLSASIEAARRDPETGIVTLTLNVVYAPLRPCRYATVLAVQCMSGRMWEFPITLVATEPHVDDVILIEATELGKTSAVGFRLTSTTRCVSSEPFTAAFLPGSSSSEFTVTPASGVLPPVGSAGALITVSFTPDMYSTHRARLTIQSADMLWAYQVKGKTPHESPPLSTTSTNGSSSVPRPANEQQRNFVALNLRLPVLANSSPLKVCK